MKQPNDALRLFADIAAHDLQEPLRMVLSYTQLLANRYQGKLDADADEFMGYAVAGARRMQLLIADLLTYCQVETAGKEIRETASEAALDIALRKLRYVIEESGGLVTHGPLPMVNADSAQLAQLFQHLIGNAIKFRAAAPPCVHVSAGEVPGTEWIFSVADNGLGIDPKHFDKIFGMFQRLHGREEFPGAGSGLTIVKKIVERHGGRLWVESEPSKGSIFHFTIPLELTP